MTKTLKRTEPNIHTDDLRLYLQAMKMSFNYFITTKNLRECAN